MATHLFNPLQLRQVILRNRVVAGPMGQYCAQHGLANDWHLVNYGKFAQGGAGMVLVETTAVEARGRCTYGDLGLWADPQVEPLSRIASFIRSQGSVPAIQLGHAGRKAGKQRPWEGFGQLSELEFRRGEVPWQTVAPSGNAFAEGWPAPVEMSGQQLEEVAIAWQDATRRAAQAGFDVLEVHFGQGFLLHEFLSPLANQRDDAYGGDSTRRMAYPLEVIKRVRAAWPAEKPLMCRISAVDGAYGGYRVEDAISFVLELKALGVDIIDCSSGGIAGHEMTADTLRHSVGMPARYSARIRHEADISTMAVGTIADAEHADDIVASGQADLIGVGCEMFDDPNWALHSRAALLDDGLGAWPQQYGWWLQRRVPLVGAADEHNIQSLEYRVAS
jgi:2,4-dienoyl-CoA reductase-like NADH-dependent reductase (Old Yellow Enzyme family)